MRTQKISTECREVRKVTDGLRFPRHARVARSLLRASVARALQRHGLADLRHRPDRVHAQNLHDKHTQTVNKTTKQKQAACRNRTTTTHQFLLDAAVDGQFEALLVDERHVPVNELVMRADGRHVVLERNLQMRAAVFWGVVCGCVRVCALCYWL